MITIIINADDLGINPNVNAAIDKALTDEVITSTSIMANSHYLPDVKAIISRHPNCSFGVHLNLSEGPSITKDDVLKHYGVIDESGFFIHSVSEKVVPYCDKELKDAICREWSAQISVLVQNGIIPDHADGHQHCHIWPGVEDVLCELLPKFQIQKVRNKMHLPLHSRNSVLMHSLSSFLYQTRLCDFSMTDISSFNNQVFNAIRLYQQRLNFEKRLIQKDIRFPGYFYDYQRFCEIAPCHNKLRNTDYCVELMCHPGHPKYVNEFDMVNRRHLDILGLNYKLISYKDL